MDTPETPKRPWWRKTRWRLLVAFWLLLPAIYVLSAGPAWYACCRWEAPSIDVYFAIYQPADALLGPTPLYDRWQDYVGWWG